MKSAQIIYVLVMATLDYSCCTSNVLRNHGTSVTSVDFSRDFSEELSRKMSAIQII